MTLRLRRGTNTQRQSIVFAEGELIYTTDTQEIYVGDGLTLGGILVTNSTLSSPPALLQNLNLNNYDILGSGNISATTISGDGSGLNNVPISATLTQNLDVNYWSIFGTGNITLSGNVFATAFIGDGSGLTNLPTGQGVISGSDYNINIVGNDSTRIIDVTNNTVTGNFVGDGSGITNLFGEFNIGVIGNDSSVIIDPTSNTVSGNFVGDLQGSVFADNSSIIINGQTKDISINNIEATSNDLQLFNNDISELQLRIVSNDNRSILKLTRKSNIDISLEPDPYGSISFERSDINGELTTGVITGTAEYIYISAGGENFFPESSYFSLSNTGKVGIGTYTAVETLDVRGSVLISGDVTAAAFKGSLVLDDSSIVIDGNTGDVFANTLTSGSLYLSTNNISTTDSSNISITPAVIFNSDVTIENDLIVANKIVAETLEVQNIITNASGTPEIASDTDIILSAGTRVEIASSPFKLASFSTAERDALSAQNGDMIYNTDANKFQGYAGGVWVNLH